MTPDELKNHARELFNNAKSAVSFLSSDFIRESAHYHGVHYRETKLGVEAVKNSQKPFINKTYTHVTRMAQSVLSVVFFDAKKMVELSDVTGQMTNEQLKVVERQMNYRLSSHPIPFYFIALNAFQDALKHKNCVVKLWADTRSKTGYTPKAENVPLEDVFFDPRANYLDYHQFPIVQRYKTTLNQLKLLGYKNLDDLEGLLNSSMNATVDAPLKNFQASVSQQGSTHSYNVSEKGLQSVWVFEIWTILKHKGKTQSVYYTMAGQETSPQIIISDVEANTFPFKREGETFNRPPFILGTPLPESNSLRGKSLVQLFYDLQKEINKRRAQLDLAIDLQMRPFLLLRSDSGINKNSLLNRRHGAVVQGDDIGTDSIRELSTNTSISGVLANLNISTSDFDETSLVSRNQLGQGSERTISAREAGDLAQNAVSRGGYIINNLLLSFVLPFFENLGRMTQEYETEESLKKVNGKLFVSLGEKGKISDFIQGNLDVGINVASRREAVLNKLNTVMQVGNQAEALNMQKIQQGLVKPGDVKLFDSSKLVGRMLEALKENADEFFVPAQTPPPAPVSNGKIPGVASQPAVKGNPEDFGQGAPNA